MKLCLRQFQNQELTVNKYAPKMIQTKIDVEKIREVIGQGGKIIQKITSECDVKIDINEDEMCSFPELTLKIAISSCHSTNNC